MGKNKTKEKRKKLYLKIKNPEKERYRSDKNKGTTKPARLSAGKTENQKEKSNGEERPYNRTERVPLLADTRGTSGHLSNYVTQASDNGSRGIRKGNSELARARYKGSERKEKKNMPVQSR